MIVFGFIDQYVRAIYYILTQDNADKYIIKYQEYSDIIRYRFTNSLWVLTQ